ncbi:hypothetical protein B6A10_02080 [Flavobacterium sp. L1I52]|uniref:Uncharacterized protein n=1 Tax=Flavobacterium pokkalii TaxID=1940408 RepID=A0ABR7UMC7_9FLAO|nr:hypothetical protein [Flavobacterium pokkalii]MBD0723961.1 hypothetical protein [Flavobacterium pokkalii]
MDIFIGIAGLVIAWLTYHKTFNSDLTEEKNNLLGVFLATQKLHLEVQEILQDYIDLYDGENHQIYTNVSFGQLLTLYKKSFEKELSDKVFQDLKNNKTYTKSNLKIFQNMLEKQQYNLLMFKNQLVILNIKTI